MYVCMYPYVCMYVRMCVRMCVYVCRYLRMYVCMYVCMCVYYVCTHTLLRTNMTITQSTICTVRAELHGDGHELPNNSDCTDYKNVEYILLRT